jgi:hypothetical protein
VTVSYTVSTDLDPEHLNVLAAELARMWTMFALGQETLGGQTLHYPSGKYANSIEFKKTGQASVAIIADEKVAPEAKWIEEGHGAYDMKTLFGGRHFRLPKHVLGHYGSRTLGEPVETMKGKKFMWMSATEEGDSQWLTVPSAKGVAKRPELAQKWIIPALPAYAPAAYLADLARNAAQTGNWGGLLR